MGRFWPFVPMRQGHSDGVKMPAQKPLPTGPTVQQNPVQQPNRVVQFGTHGHSLRDQPMSVPTKGPISASVPYQNMVSWLPKQGQVHPAVKLGNLLTDLCKAGEASKPGEPWSTHLPGLTGLTPHRQAGVSVPNWVDDRPRATASPTHPSLAIAVRHVPLGHTSRGIKEGALAILDALQVHPVPGLLKRADIIHAPKPQSTIPEIPVQPVKYPMGGGEGPKPPPPS